MTKLGRKIATANGEAKATYSNKLPTDVIAHLKRKPNAAKWLEDAIRKDMARATKRSGRP